MDFQRVAIDHARLPCKVISERHWCAPRITADVSKIIERMSEVQVERQLALQHRGIVDQWKVTTEWLKDCIPVFEDLATKANQRLFREERETTHG